MNNLTQHGDGLSTLGPDLDGGCKPQKAPAWAETTYVPPAPPLREFRRKVGRGELHAEERSNGKWWLYYDLSGGKHIEPSADPPLEAAESLARDVLRAALAALGDNQDAPEPRT